MCPVLSDFLLRQKGVGVIGDCIYESYDFLVKVCDDFSVGEWQFTHDGYDMVFKQSKYQEYSYILDKTSKLEDDQVNLDYISVPIVSRSSDDGGATDSYLIVEVGDEGETPRAMKFHLHGNEKGSLWLKDYTRQCFGVRKDGNRCENMCKTSSTIVWCHHHLRQQCYFFDDTSIEKVFAIPSWWIDLTEK